MWLKCFQILRLSMELCMVYAMRALLWSVNVVGTVIVDVMNDDTTWLSSIYR